MYSFFSFSYFFVICPIVLSVCMWWMVDFGCSVPTLGVVSKTSLTVLCCFFAYGKILHPIMYTTEMLHITMSPKCLASIKLNQEDLAVILGTLRHLYRVNCLCTQFSLYLHFFTFKEIARFVHAHTHTYIYIYIYSVVNRYRVTSVRKEEIKHKLTGQTNSHSGTH